MEVDKAHRWRLHVRTATPPNASVMATAFGHGYRQGKSSNTGSMSTGGSRKKSSAPTIDATLLEVRSILSSFKCITVCDGQPYRFRTKFVWGGQKVCENIYCVAPGVDEIADVGDISWQDFGGGTTADPSKARACAVHTPGRPPPSE